MKEGAQRGRTAGKQTANDCTGGGREDERILECFYCVVLSLATEDPPLPDGRVQSLVC